MILICNINDLDRNIEYLIQTDVVNLVLYKRAQGKHTAIAWETNAENLIFARMIDTQQTEISCTGNTAHNDPDWIRIQQYIQQYGWQKPGLTKHDSGSDNPPPKSLIQKVFKKLARREQSPRWSKMDTYIKVVREWVENGKSLDIAAEKYSVHGTTIRRNLKAILKYAADPILTDRVKKCLEDHDLLYYLE